MVFPLDLNLSDKEIFLPGILRGVDIPKNDLELEEFKTIDARLTIWLCMQWDPSSSQRRLRTTKLR